MGRWVGTMKREETFIQDFNWKNRSETDSLEDLGIDGRLILNPIVKE
jgi:hypothetical protein